MKLAKKKTKHRPSHPPLPVANISREVTTALRARPAPADLPEATKAFSSEFFERVCAEPISRKGWMAIMNWGGCVIVFGLNPCNADPHDPMILDVTGWSKKKMKAEHDLFFETLCTKCHAMNVTPEHDWTHGEVDFRDISQDARDRANEKLPVAADGIREVEHPQEVMDAWQNAVQEIIDEAEDGECLAAHISLTGGQKFLIAFNPIADDVLALDITNMPITDVKRATDAYMASACHVCAQLRAMHPQLETVQ